jgi:hypothetical protein
VHDRDSRVMLTPSPGRMASGLTSYVIETPPSITMV